MSYLKSCPFCGEPAIEQIENNGAGCFWVICDNVKGGCGCEGPYKHSPEDAVSAWNRRAHAEDEAPKILDQEKIAAQIRRQNHKALLEAKLRPDEALVWMDSLSDYVIVDVPPKGEHPHFCAEPDDNTPPPSVREAE